LETVRMALTEISIKERSIMAKAKPKKTAAAKKSSQKNKEGTNG